MLRFLWEAVMLLFEVVDQSRSRLFEERKAFSNRSCDSGRSRSEGVFETVAKTLVENQWNCPWEVPLLTIIWWAMPRAVQPQKSQIFPLWSQDPFLPELGLSTGSTKGELGWNVSQLSGSLPIAVKRCRCKEGSTFAPKFRTFRWKFLVSKVLKTCRSYLQIFQSDLLGTECKFRAL